MGVATATGKQLLMTAFMLWMSGNQIQLFSIMMVGMAMFSPVKALFSVNSSMCAVCSHVKK